MVVVAVGTARDAAISMCIVAVPRELHRSPVAPFFAAGFVKAYGLRPNGMHQKMQIHPLLPSGKTAS